jgi:hypothetical protein
MCYHVLPQVTTGDPCFTLGLGSWRCQHIWNQRKWETNYNVIQWDAIQVYKNWDSLS